MQCKINFIQNITLAVNQSNFLAHLCKYKIKNIKRGRPQSDSTSKSTNSPIIVNQIVDKRFRDRSDASYKDIDDIANDAHMNLSIEVDILANARTKISKVRTI